METIFLNSENSERSDPDRRSLNLTDKQSQEKKINILLYQDLTFTIHGKR